MNNRERIDFLVQHLDLQDHPEGGYYKELYRSIGTIPASGLDGFCGERNYCTSIYFLLTSDNFSGYHRIKQDEIWHFYEGSSLYVHVIDLNGNYIKHEVGNDLSNGIAPQLVVPAGCWFASSVKDNNSYSLVGCTVAPGFDFNDFELAKRDELLKKYPQHSATILKLTR